MDSDRTSLMARLLCTHPAVTAATVTAGADGRESVAWLVPDPSRAPLLHRAAALEATGRLGTLGWHEPADDLRVAGVNRSETDFLYREIFAGNAYFKHGVTLPPDAVVVDAGANIGMFTLAVARRSPGARVIAVEPVEELAAAAAVNAELHGVDAVVLRCALGRAESETDFTYYPHNSVMSGGFAQADEDLDVLRGYLLTGEGAEDGAHLDRLAADRMTAVRRRVPTTTLTRIAAEHGLTRIDLLKVDVEKAEAQVLDGIDAALWPRIDRIVMEVHDIDGRLASVLGTLTAQGFSVTHEQDPRLTLTPCHHVYAHRPEATAHDREPSSGTVTAVDHGPNLRTLDRELRALLTREDPSAGTPGRFVVVPGLDKAITESPAPAPDATGRTGHLAEIWAGLFGSQAVRPDADFFDLGGDSLTAVRLLAQVEERLGEDALTPDLIFTDGTFGGLAAAIEASAPERASAAAGTHRAGGEERSPEHGDL
ncbi:31-O-demethyl-FK506 methyltransferase [Streptomyces sp. NRRL B-1140]|uniref:FkbM family methyltransferase n=1 Tax=Streptomyces sp. NRRL B-1140 TaxID=1415549 RepID=UPI0006B069D4|nr:FkbM family methyltransferase [Streptomyces sp. NRRL B-1140]KOX04369.1 31-O-demethyl-FK506 methyltransferase [Streptomyces sp. NRRL B-1140]